MALLVFSTFPVTLTSTSLTQYPPLTQMLIGGSGWLTMHGISERWKICPTFQYVHCQWFILHLNSHRVGTISISSECALVLDPAPVQLHLQASIHSYASPI
jgi:hypothetical protein